MGHLKRILKKIGRAGTSSAGINYEEAWDESAASFGRRHPELQYIGDEWNGIRAGAAKSNDEYVKLIREQVIDPFVQEGDVVLEIGVGGGRTTAMALEAGASRVICADVSSKMLQATKDRLGTERVDYVKLNGLTLDPIPDATADVFLSFDTMVHIEPRDIFNILAHVPSKLKPEGRRACLFHHTDTLSELGLQRYLSRLG